MGCLEHLITILNISEILLVSFKLVFRSVNIVHGYFVRHDSSGPAVIPSQGSKA